MLGRHILNGDTVVLKHGLAPVDGDVVAVFIDNINVLRTVLIQNGKVFLKDDRSKAMPAQGFVIQGVMIGLIRKR